jgi:hypothetical protein
MHFSCTTVIVCWARHCKLIDLMSPIEQLTWTTATLKCRIRPHCIACLQCLDLYAFLLYHGDCVLGQTLQARNAMWANSTFKSCRCSSRLDVDLIDLMSPIEQLTWTTATLKCRIRPHCIHFSCTTVIVCWARHCKHAMQCGRIRHLRVAVVQVMSPIEQLTWTTATLKCRIRPHCIACLQCLAQHTINIGILWILWYIWNIEKKLQTIYMHFSCTTVIVCLNVEFAHIALRACSVWPSTQSPWYRRNAYKLSAISSRSTFKSCRCSS